MNEIKKILHSIPKDAFKSVGFARDTILNMVNVHREYINADFKFNNRLPDYLRSCRNDSSDDSDINNESLKV